jgi:hypothetical protein
MRDLVTAMSSIHPANVATTVDRDLDRSAKDRRFLNKSAGIAFDHPSASHDTARERTMVVKIMPNDKGQPNGKLADAEVHFTDGALEGLKLLGFAVWERRNGPGRNVTFPARTYSVNGERRSFSLLRPVTDSNSQNRVRDLVLQAYAEFEAQAAVAS